MLSFNYSKLPQAMQRPTSKYERRLCERLQTNMVLPSVMIFEVVSVSMDPQRTGRLGPERPNRNIIDSTTISRGDGRVVGISWSGKRAEHPVVWPDNRRISITNTSNERKFYSHPPVFILLSPEGKIVRYIHGLDYDPNDNQAQALSRIC